MFAHLPQNLRRRIFALNVVVTIFAGVVLFFLFLLIGLLYWMHAERPPPEPARLIHPEATAYCIVDIAGAAPSDGTDFSTLTMGMPSSAMRLIKKGLSNEDCDVRVVACLAPAAAGPDLLLSVSLSKYVGQFHVVRRDIERRKLEKVQTHHNKAVFTIPESETMPVLGIARCSLLRGSDPDNIKMLISRLLATTTTTASWPDPQQLRSECRWSPDYWGWAKSWQQFPVAALLPPETAKRIEAFQSSLVAAFPNLEHAENIRFWGQFTEEAPLRISFRAPDADTDEGFNKQLGDWLQEHAVEIGFISSGTSWNARDSEIVIELRLAGGQE